MHFTYASRNIRKNEKRNNERKRVNKILVTHTLVTPGVSDKILLIVENATKDITEYPVAELIVASGFFIVLSLEQIVMGVCVAKNEGKKKNKKEHGHEHKNHDSGKTKTDDSINRLR